VNRRNGLCGSRLSGDAGMLIVCRGGHRRSEGLRAFSRRSVQVRIGRYLLPVEVDGAPGRRPAPPGGGQRLWAAADLAEQYGEVLPVITRKEVRTRPPWRRTLGGRDRPWHSRREQSRTASPNVAKHRRCGMLP
jgi:hypothetical protein